MRGALGAGFTSIVSIFFFCKLLLSTCGFTFLLSSKLTYSFAVLDTFQLRTAASTIVNLRGV